MPSLWYARFPAVRGPSSTSDRIPPEGGAAGGIWNKYAMRSDRWSFVPTALGFLLLAAGAADGHELVMSSGDEEWSLLVRANLELLVGFWLVCGLAPRWARIATVTAFVGILASDLARIIAGYPVRPWFGGVAVASWWILCSDLIILVALSRWLPASDRVAWIDSHPGRVAGTTLIAAALGIVIDWSQVGRFPIVATARSGGTASSPGLDYLVYLPEGYYRSRVSWPLILDLHGGGAWGRDIQRVRTGGLPRRIDAGLRLPFIVVAPQSPRQGWDPAPLNALLDDVLRWSRVDADLVYLTGSSMGGYGVWALATAHPERFAAIAPICGGGDPASADQLRGVPTWAFHGAEDTVIPPDESRRMVAAQNRAGGNVRLTIYPGVGHDAATPTYTDPSLYVWFLTHRRHAGGIALK